MNPEKIKNNYPHFYKTCLYLSRAIFYQNVFKASEDINLDYELAEKICEVAFKICQSNWDDYFKKVQNLLELDMDFLKSQVLFEKTGRYKYSTFKEVEENVFNAKSDDQPEGVKYLWGLYFSQMFWKTHWKVFDFYLKEFVKNNQEKGFCLEAPSGSGIFIAHFLANNKDWQGKAVDLSESAIDISKKILGLMASEEKFQVIKQDVYQYQPDIRFDRIICGEFLEHVEDPLGVLKKMESLLVDNGKIFLTVAVWAAASDHIYLYKNVDEVKNHIHQAGLTIDKELVAKVFEKDKDVPEQDEKAILYAAILKKANF